MKKIYTILLAIFFTVPFVKAQQVIVNSDTVDVTEETVRFIVPEHRGKVQWQFSSDSLSWIDVLNEKRDTLEINVQDTSGYFRAKITEGDCLPVFSDVSLFRFALPSTQLPSVDDITISSAKLSAGITDNGGATVTKRGFYWSTDNMEPDENDNVVNSGSGTGIYSEIIDGLEANTTYYFRAFATNTKGTALSDVVSFTTTVNLPLVVTMDAIDIKTNSVRLKGDVTSDGGSQITSRGFYWSTTDMTPDKNDNIENAGFGLGTYYKSVSELQPGTKYYFCAYATNSEGTAVGVVKTFTTQNEEPIATDSLIYAGRKYNIVQIGNQWWMAENLAYLPQVNALNDGSMNSPKYYVYGYDGTNVEEAKQAGNYTKYGVLYNWEAAKSACPDGWHLPTDGEWEQLAQFISQDNGGYSKDNQGTWSNVGGKLKSKSGWYINNGTDDYLFRALPGGYRGLGYEADNSNILDFYGYYGIAGFWSATSYDSENAWGRMMILDTKNFIRPYRSKDSGASVRCVKD